VPAVFADRALGVPRVPAVALTLAPPSGDLRDAIDHGTDLVRTADPDLLDYARRRPGASVTALPWDRTYALVLPAGSAGVGAAIAPDTAAFRSALASDAVRADARAAVGPFWWEVPAACIARPAPKARRAPSNAIAYPASDAAARGLAERIVALASSGGIADAGTDVVARGFPADSFAMALRLGTERGYVVVLPLHAPVPCRESAGWPPHASVLPLVDTRAYAVLRRGAPALVIEWDGAVRPAEVADTSSSP
jgi:hypothetical protein